MRVGIVLAIVATLAAIGLARLPLLQTAEWKLYDQRLRWTAQPDRARQDIVVVAIDETSLRRLEPVIGRWPWPRLVHAHLVDFLREAGAKVIVYDVLFVDQDRRSGFDVGGETWSGQESDTVFADAVAKAGMVVMLADVTYEGLRNESTPSAETIGAATRFGRPVAPADGELERRPTMLAPYPALREAVRAVGHNLMIVDADGPVRRVAPLVRVTDRVVPSLALAGALAAQGLPLTAVASVGQGLAAGTTSAPLLRELLPRFVEAGADERGTAGAPSGAAASAGPVSARRLLINYRGPAVKPDGRSTTFREVSFYDVFYSREQQLAGETPLLNPADFKDRVVVVGTTAAGLFDVFATPFGSTGAMAGAVVHANVIDSWLSNRFIQRAGPASMVAVTLLAALATCWCLLGLGRRSLGWAAAAVTGCALVLGAAVVWAFGRGLWIPLVEPLLAMGVVFGGGYVLERRETRVVKQLFSRYLSRDVYQRLLANPQAAELGGARRDMTVLFSDVRGFTAMSERGSPEEIVAQLNEYFTAMVDLVFANGGTVDKFVGDMVMALYGAPLDDERHADRAVKTAVAMVEALDGLNRRWREQGRPTLAIGIGINSGEMIAGNIGSERIRSYTVIGDAVNLGSRLESLNKEKGTSIIVSEATVQRLKEAHELRPLGSVVVRGRQQPVVIFEVRTPGGTARLGEGAGT